MSAEYGIRDRIRDIIDGTVDADRRKKESMQGQIDKADHIFRFFLPRKCLYGGERIKDGEE